MAYQMMVTLSDQEYAALEAEAIKSGKQPETVLHEIMARQLHSSLTTETTKRPLTASEFMEQQYREGKLLNIPTRRGLTQEEQAELERLGSLFADSKPLSEMVIEDRGPY